MNPSLATPTPAGAIRRAVARMWADDDSRSVLIGVLGVLLVHLLLLLFAPVILRTEAIPVRRANHPAKTFNIQIQPQAVPKAPPKPPPSRFVEANPNAPENVPDKTNNFAAQNQQASQQKPQTNAHNDRPQIDGRKDVSSTQIVTGQLTKPQLSVPVAPTVETPVKTTVAPRMEQNPLAGFDKAQGDDPLGFGSNIAKVPDNPKPIPEQIQGAKDGTLADGAKTAEQPIDPKHPRPRVSLQEAHVRPAIFQDNPIGTSNIGVGSWDAKWSNYGVYLQRLIEAVQLQWDQILQEARTYPTPGTEVKVKFRLDSKGKISAIVDVGGTSTDQGKGYCVSAITSRAPYGDWTDDMIAALGTSTELTFVFYYQ